MNKVLGIDLGTTNTVASIMEGGQPIVIPSAEGDSLIPSVVGFSKTGERLIGAAAKRQAISNPERTISSIKRHMGTDYKVTIDGKEYTPQEISAMILQKVKADAEVYLGYPIEKAIITVPAYFNDGERQATKDAGTIAGLEVLRIINEPTASSMAYGQDKIDKSEKILVWDLGGGTFDVSIIQIGDGIFEVNATAGDMRLGGDDWDQRIMDWLIEEFKKSNNIDLRTDRVAMQRLKEAAEQAKIILSSDTSTKINLPFIAADATGPKHLDLELTRQKFQEMTADLVDKCKESVDKALKDSGLSISQIAKVLLVGGSTRMPAVQDKARKIFGKEPSKEIDPDKVVAMGAAIQGGVLSGDVKDMVLLDVTSLSLGIETVGGVFTKLIERNTQIPCSKSRMFTTATDGQTTVEVHVLQGERDLAANNKSLGRFELRNIPPALRGIPQIEVMFEIDANGIVNVSAKDMATGNKQKITIQSPTNLTNDEINQMVKEAAVYAEADAKRREETQTRNKGNVELDTAERTLRELAEQMTLDEQKAIRAAADQLRSALQTYDNDKIRTCTKALQEQMYRVTTNVYINVDGSKLDKTMETNADGEPQVSVSGDEPSEDDLFGWFQQ